MTALTVDGRAVELARLGSGAPLLYLHGLADVHAVWPPDEPTQLLRRLAETRDVIAPAHPGYLGSDALPAGADVEDHTFHLVDLLDTLELDAVDIVGCSFGGWLAAELALRQPSRVKRLALVNPLGVHVRGRTVALFFGAVAPRGVGGYGEVRGVLFAEPDSEIAMHAFPDQPDRERMLRWFTGLTGAAQVGWKSPQLSNPKLAGRLPRITAATLALVSDGDAINPLAAKLLRDAAPSFTVETIDGGHCVHLEQPDVVATRVLEFLA